MDYSGKIITKNAVTPTQTAASGVWTLDDALQAQKGNNWPIPGVPNPISKSLRFNSADVAYLNRTPSVQGNRRIFTWSAWCKRSALGSSSFQMLFSTEPAGAIETVAWNNDSFRISFGGGTYNLTTTPVYRDPSAWYHIVAAVDTTQATTANRVKLYVNGVQITTLGTANYPVQNYDTAFNNTQAHYLSGSVWYNDWRFNGYMTEINFVDGQALAASDFGMTDTNTGVWIPKKYTGTYGTNGFYVNFKDATNTSTLGLDYSGNGNNWNANNFSVTAGAGNDSLTDVPTPWVGYALNTEAGGVVRGNYATLNPLQTGIDLSNGNLDFTNGAANESSYSTIAMTSGKWYCEAIFTVEPSTAILGVSAIGSINTASYIGSNSGSYGWDTNGNKYNNGSGSAYGSARGANDVIGCAFDLDAGTITYYLNGVSQGTAFSSIPAGTYFFGVSSNNSTGNINFGQRPFAYTPPAGFLSLCTTNLPTPTIGATSSTTADKYFNTVLRNGFGTSGGTVTTGFYPDFVWQKQRNGLSDHYLVNTIAGGTKTLSSNTTAAEATDANWITAFSSTGFTQGSSDFGNSSTTIAVWAWNANSGSTVSNTAGSITSTVSANTTAGFSVVTYTGTGASATVGHGLGVAPSMIIAKWRTGGTTQGWIVYHASTGASQYLVLNTTAAAATNAPTWVTSPTSTVFSVSTDNWNNGNGWTFVAYCFAPVAGYSAFGSYTGNGSADGPFIYTGFRPAFILVKCSSTGSTNWFLWDNKINSYNVASTVLLPNSSGAELGSRNIDILSNGFKCRANDSNFNGSGDTYIYAAFAESPFKFSNAR